MPRLQPNRQLNFTKAALLALPKPDAERVYYHDTKTPGLCLCIAATGSRTFYLYRKVAGKPERVRLGTFPELSVEQARTLCQSITGRIADGRDPQAEKRAARNRPTLAVLWEHWFSTHAKVHKRTWDQDERMYRKYLVEFHQRPLATITTAQVAAWHGRIGQQHGRVMANRVLNLLSTLFNAADRVGFEGRNPCGKVKRFREESRERFLLPAEMKAFFDALAEEPDPWKDFFLLCLFTGARRGNVASARWDEIDLDGGTWRIPAAESKNGRSMLLPLVPLAVNLLLARRPLCGSSPWVFPLGNGERHVLAPKRAWGRLVKRAGIENLHIHDLRRSLGSWAAAAGTSLAIIGAALGHKTLRSTQIYSRLQTDVVREAVTRTTEAMVAAAHGGNHQAALPAQAEKGSGDGEDQV